ncbi:hypothetical protein FB157_102515 [Streptomyces sp. BK340]|nr:hypothetical protein FB157_102515 [Streptomyces sp. BK340]
MTVRFLALRLAPVRSMIVTLAEDVLRTPRPVPPDGRANREVRHAARFRP